MPPLHHQYQVRLTNGLRRKLNGLVLMGQMTMLREYGVCCRLDGLARQGGKAGRTDLNIGMDECPAQQMLRGGTAAYIANTDNQNPFKQDDLPRLVNIGGDLALAEHKSFKLRMRPGVDQPGKCSCNFKNNQCVFITMTFEQPPTFSSDKK
jgi:hypothetical protein